MTTTTSVSSVTTQQVGPCEVRVWQTGTGSGLLYLHGYEQHPGAAPFLERLGEHRDVRAPELPGYGESTGLEQLDDILDLALLWRRLIEDWGFDSVDVVGHSLGGMVAAELAVVAPHRVRKLVLVDSYGLWLDDLPLVDQFALSPPDLAAAKWHDPAAAPDPEPSALSDTSPLGKAISRTRNLGSATKFMWPIPDRGLARRLPHLTVPTLVLHGESDGLVPVAYARELAGRIPDATLVTIPGAGHLPMIEAEDAFLDAVTRFLD